MTNPTLSNTVSVLESFFSKLNDKLFGGELPKPVITVSPDTKRQCYGWCTTWKAWRDSHDNDIRNGFFEINICAEYLGRPIDEVCGTLLHEMVHLYNLESGIQDCSRGGYYHNTNFKDAAKAHGLNVEKDEKYGWSRTSLTDETKNFIKSFENSVLPLYRVENKKPQTQNLYKRLLKYYCPMCGCRVRATREVHIICAECNSPYKLGK